MAVGAEYRRSTPRRSTTRSLVAGNTENLATNSAGGYHVSEGYIEVSLPVFKDFAPAAAGADARRRLPRRELLDGRQRRRLQVQRHLRAGELAQAAHHLLAARSARRTSPRRSCRPSSGFFNITDPCSAENIQNNVNYAKNCAAAGIPAGFMANTNASITGTTSGNPNLEPEHSISYTGGFVFQPPIVPDLAITLDYYSIKIKDAISQVQAQDIINNCFGSAPVSIRPSAACSRAGPTRTSTSSRPPS